MLKKIEVNYKKNLQDKNFSEILTGSVLTFSVKILTVIFGFITNFIITKYYGAEVLGVISILFSIMSIASIFSLLGIDVAILRFLPPMLKRKEYTNVYFTMQRAIRLVFVFSMISVLTVYMLSDLLADSFFKKTYLNSFIILVSFFIFPQVFTSLAISFIRSLQNIKLFILFQFLPSFLNLILLSVLTYFFYYKYAPLYSQLSIQLIISLVSFLFMYKYIYNIKQSSTTLENTSGITYKGLLSVSTPMFLTAAMQMVVLQTDILMLGSLSTAQNVGIYSIVIKLAMLNSFIISSINTIIAPKFSELYYNHEIFELKSVARKSTKLIFFATLFINIILLLFGSQLLSIFGDEFIIGYYALVLLAIGQFSNAIFGSVGYLLNMTGHQNTLNKIVMSSAILNVLLNFFLIPLYGINGAAFASMISTIYWNFLASFYVKKYLGFYIGYIPKLRRNRNED